MATRDGLCRYDGLRFKIFQPRTDYQPSLSSAGLSGLKIDAKGDLWVRTDHNEIDQFDPVRETVANVSKWPQYRQQIGQDTLHDFYPDRHNRLWLLLSNRGLACIDLSTRHIRRFRHQATRPVSLSSDLVTAIAEDGQGTIWVATQQGLDHFDESTASFTHYRHREKDPTSLPDHTVWIMHRRHNGDVLLLSERYLSVLDYRTHQIRSMAMPRPGPLWVRHQITTDTKGNDYIDRDNQFYRFSDLGHGALRPSQLVSLTPPQQDWYGISLLVDRSDVLWVGTNTAGVRKFNLRSEPFTTLPYKSSFHRDLLTDWLSIPASQVPPFGANVSSYNLRSALDRHNQLWFTVGGTPFYRIDLSTKVMTPVPFPLQIQEADNDRPTLLATDPTGRIWALHDSLLYRYEESLGMTVSQPPGHWIHFPHSFPSVGSPLLQMVVDQQAVWIITGSEGLLRLDQQTGRFRQYRHNPADSTSLSSNQLYCLFADPTDNNTLWIGTFGAGLYQFDKRTGRCRRITTHNGLPNNVVYAAIPDGRGRLWVATNRGLCRVDRRTGQTRTYTREDGLPADEFNRFHFLQLPDGYLILGGIEGIVGFYPDQLTEDHYQPPVELTGLAINNRVVEPGAHSVLGLRPIQLLDELHLPYNQNFLTIDFAALEFNNPARLRYRYRLEGVDKDWILTDRPQAIYTNLAPSTYRLTLNAANTSGQWSPHQRQLTIAIHPPWWASGGANLIYLLAMASLLWWLSRNYLRQREARHLQTVAQLKERFFANITHEFRTPLTLLLGPAERIMAESDQPAIRDQGRLIHRYGQQLLGLVNQLLDLAKLDASMLKVEEARGDLVAFVSEQIQGFKADALTKGITLELSTELTEGLYWFDRDKLTTIVTNLISNALKFTGPGGRVEVRLIRAQQTTPVGILLQVTDTGIGIAADQIPHIFDRFYQVDSGHGLPWATDAIRAYQTSSLRQASSGIGLALVNELVGLLGGDIQVESTVGQGTTFTLRFPLRPATAADYPPKVHPLKSASFDTNSVSKGEAMPVVLVVEDNQDLATFIAHSLPDSYQIYQASDGRLGLELARQLVPDLIISDVMMPQMDGYELVRQLKDDLLTHHVPIMLLTAKGSLSSKLEGLRGGADEYLTKPFVVDELRLRVANLLENRQRLRERLRQQWQQPTSQLPPLEDDDPLLTQVYTLLNDHLDHPSFGIEELTHALGMSRMSLHRKLKALTDLSTGELIRSYRLKRALELLKNGKRVSETAYAVGFESPSHFSQRFREQFGRSPSEWLADQAS